MIFFSTDERIGTNGHLNWPLQGFHEAIIDFNLHDLPMEGYQFTWAKQHGEFNAIEEWLDKGLATLEWFDLFSNSKLINGLAAKSDHSPIIIHLHGTNRRSFKRQFRFENSWLLELDMVNIVDLAWEPQQTSDFIQIRFQYQDQIDICKHELE